MGGPALNQEGPQDSVKKFLLNSKNSRGGQNEFEGGGRIRDFQREIRGGGRIRDFQNEFEGGGVGFEISRFSRENSRGGG